ncbi:MAG: RNA polymerase sigma factor [Nocardioides sp.]
MRARVTPTWCAPCSRASYRRLVGQLYGVCGDLTEAEEVVAEAFARAVQHQRTFAHLDNPEAWLRTVAVNVSRTRLRRRLAAVRGRDEVRHPALDDDRLVLMAALRKLPAAQREAIALHYLADLPIHEVASATGSPVGTVKARLSRGRAALAVLLADNSDSTEEAHHG